MAKTPLVMLLLAGLVMLQSCADAANCTSDEQTTIDDIYSNLSDGTCASLISDTDATSVDYCLNSDCLSALGDAVDQLPDCMGDDEVDRKTGLQAIVTYCSTVTDELNESASASGSTSGTDGSTVSGAVATREAVAMGVLSAAILFFTGLL